jgi:hypothetical protein
MMFDYYPLTRYQPEDKDVMAMQFNDPESGEGLAAVYIRKETDGRPFTAKLFGLDQDAHYKVYEIDTPDQARVIKGGQLMNEGIVVDTATRPRACLYFYSLA